MRQKSSPKLMLLMTLPVVALLFVGWFLRDKRGTFTPPLPQTGPLRMVMTDVKFEELKPREVAEGFDTKITVTVNLAGQRPKFGAPFSLQPFVPKVNLKYANSRKSEAQLQESDDFAVNLNDERRTNFRLLHGGNWTTARSSRYSFLLKHRKLARQNTDVFLQASLNAELWGSRWFKVKGAAPVLVQNTRLGVIKSLTWQTIIHKANEIVTLPVVSKETGVEITKTGTKDYAPSHPIANGVATKEVFALLLFNVDIGGLRHAPRARTYDIYLQDEKGKKYRTYQKNVEQEFYVGGYGWSRPTSGPESYFYDPNYKLNARFPVSALPRNAKQLTFKFKVSVDDAWPTQVSVPIRK